MASTPFIPSFQVYRGRILSVSQEQAALRCTFANRARVLLPLLLANHIASGDEIVFTVPAHDAVGPEVHVTKASSANTNNRLYLVPIGRVSQPKLDKRDQSFVSAHVRNGGLGISCVFLACEALRDYFYRVPSNGRTPEFATLYETLRIVASASPAEIRVAFKLRALELKTIGAARAEYVTLERAFNILGHPELRAHYDSLLANPEIPAAFPYGGVGSLLVAVDRSRSGETFFARRILAFVPERTHRRFRMPVRNCEFYADRALCRDVRRKLQFWLDPALLHISWDPSWNRWKHLLSSRLEVDGVFVRSGKYKKRDGEWKFVDWETGLPSRLSVKLPTDFAQDIERARNAYSRFGQYSRALDQIRLCLAHKAIERKDLEQMCSDLGIPGEFDVAQINWRPDYDPVFYRELSRRARRIYLFRDEYIFEVEKGVVAETPQLGHATYVFAKPRDMGNFLARYTKTTKANIRNNQDNAAEGLGFLVRIVHSANPGAWLLEIRKSLGE
jgi:hypothetical protein